MNDTSKNTTRPEKNARGKKPYQPPQLVVYGSLDRLTKGGSGTKNEPGGPNTPNTKIG